MKAGKIILKWALILVLAFTTFNWFISPEYKVERSIEINVPNYIIYDQVSNLHNWPNWAVWWKQDTTISNEFSGENSGKGATIKWNGQEVGVGGLEIIESNLSGMKTSLDLGGMTASGEWKFEPVENSTKVTWGIKGKMPFFMRFFTLFFNKMAGPDFEKGLAGLKEVCESLPSRSSEINN